jgi:hypothetical protein
MLTGAAPTAAQESGGPREEPAAMVQVGPADRHRFSRTAPSR